jgi:hypothetical protein
MVMLSSSKLATAFSPRALAALAAFIQPMAPKMMLRFKRYRGT